MPKRKQSAIEEAVTETPATQLSKRVQTLIDAIRQPFTDYANAFQALTVSRSELAAKFMKAYAAWSAEVAGSFVAFVRLLDATVPEDREGYRAHSAYQAADYLRRLVAQAAKPAVAEGEATAPRPVQPIEVVARLVATLSPFVDDMELIWTAFARELHWSERQVAHIQRLVGQAGPLLTKRGREHKLHRVA